MNAFTDLPLALFTTLAPLAAGGFVGLCIASLMLKDTEGGGQKIARYSWGLWILALIGLICSFFHLADPAHALNVIHGVGSSPLSNEVLVAGIFGLLSLVYCIVFSVKKVNAKANKVALVVVALSALLLMVFCGLAYCIATIPSWNSPASVLTILGFGLSGGIIAALLLYSLAKTGEQQTRAFKVAFAVVMVAALVIALIALFVQIATAAGLPNYLLDGGALFGAALPYAIAALICGLVAALLGLVGLFKRPSAGLYVVAVILIAVAALCARLAFYSVQMGVAL
jgi:anaerobic dimethyl sulfoxide reductase subunit C (anchor subunit)/Tat-targeted selenate reductase subunit YnfH